MEHVVVVGASLAGLRAAEALRGGGFTGRLTMVGAEPHQPYDRPPLTKKLLAGEWEPDRIVLRRPEVFEGLDAEWRLGVRAEDLDTARAVVSLDDGAELAYDGLVIATGAAPRALPGEHDHPDLLDVRTVDDALALRSRISAGGRRVVVVGAGFIGLEVAATARTLGNDVVVLEGAPAPLVRALGPVMGTEVAAIHADHGVEVRCGVAVSAIRPDGVELADGTLVPADVVVVGIGVAPVTGWLEGSGLELRDGVVCDAALSTGAPGVVAAGDVVRWWNPLFEEEMRVEHWSNAAEQGAVASATLLALDRGDDPAPYAPVPFFWSDQYAHRVQFLGRAGGGDEVEVAVRGAEGRRFLALYHRDGRLRGALGLDAPKLVMPFRKLLEGRASVDEARATLASATL